MVVNCYSGFIPREHIFPTSSSEMLNGQMDKTILLGLHWIPRMFSTARSLNYFCSVRYDMFCFSFSPNRISLYTFCLLSTVLGALGVYNSSSNHRTLDHKELSLDSGKGISQNITTVWAFSFFPCELHDFLGGYAFVKVFLWKRGMNGCWVAKGVDCRWQSLVAIQHLCPLPHLRSMWIFHQVSTLLRSLWNWWAVPAMSPE